MSTQLTLHAVSKAYAHGQVLNAVTGTVRDGERAAVVGENGAGKSTLLRLLAGQELPDEGEVVATADGGIGYLGQVLELPDTATVGAAIDAALSDLRDLQRRVIEAEQVLGTGEAGLLNAYGEMLTAFELRDGYRPTRGCGQRCPPWGSASWHRIARSARSPVGSGRGSRWPVCCRPNRSYSYSTSPPTISTRRLWPGWRTGCTGTGERLWW